MEWLRLLRRMTGRPTEPTEPPLDAVTVLAETIKNANAFARLNTQLPLKDASGQHSFVRREAVLNRAERVAGYEFTLMTRLRTRMTRRGGTATRAYDAALLARLAMHDVPSLLGSRLAFVSLSIDSLDNETIDRLPKENTVLTFEMTSHSNDWNALGREFARLKEKGFCHGVHIFDAADTECPLLAESEFIQIDVTAFDGLDLRALTRRLKHLRTDGKPAPRLIAREVQSDDDYQLCFKSGFDLFQGPFVSSRDSLRPTHNTINRMTVLPILSMLRSDRNYSEIANQLKNEPTLSYKLLRYLNSAAIATHPHIDNLTQALVLLGRDKFYRWTSLLLFDIENPGYLEHLLSERALTRGRSLELLAGMGRIPRLPDQLFLIGLFSLLDRVLDRPLPELVVKAALPDVVRDALLGLPGPCTDALALVVLAEADTRTHPDLLARALDVCGVSDHDFSPIAAAALVWADHVLDVGTA
jgi:EAL and modified HD-GYP domain-containing signal transduction protein